MDTDTESQFTGSTLSLNSPFSFSIDLITPSPEPISSSQPPLLSTPPRSHKSTLQSLSTSTSTLAFPRDLSPFKGRPLWDPDDDEWAEVDAHQIVPTFKATFRNPAQPIPPNSSTLTQRLSNTIIRFLPASPTKTLPPSSSCAHDAELKAEEHLRDKLNILQNPYYSNPSGDLCDEIMKSMFLHGSRYFTALASQPRQMHVIDLEAYFNTQDPLLQIAHPRLCDAVATVLSHTTTSCVEAFLDPRVREFLLRREIQGRKAGTMVVVRRYENEVFAGVYRNLGFHLQWSLYTHSRIGVTGHWYTVYASLMSGSSPIVNGIPDWHVFFPENEEIRHGDVTSDTSSASGEPRKIALACPDKEEEESEDDELSPRNHKFMLYQSRLLARYLLRDVWVRFDGLFECKAVWEKDGIVVGDVRVKRGMVGFGEED